MAEAGQQRSAVEHPTEAAAGPVVQVEQIQGPNPEEKVEQEPLVVEVAQTQEVVEALAAAEAHPNPEVAAVLNLKEAEALSVRRMGPEAEPELKPKAVEVLPTLGLREAAASPLVVAEAVLAQTLAQPRHPHLGLQLSQPPPVLVGLRSVHQHQPTHQAAQRTQLHRLAYLRQLPQLAQLPQQPRLVRVPLEPTRRPNRTSTIHRCLRHMRCISSRQLLVRTLLRVGEQNQISCL